MRRRRIIGAGSDHGSDGSKSENGELHDDGVFKETDLVDV